MIPPDTGDLVEKRFQRVRIQSHQPDGEVRGHEGVGQRSEAERDQEELKTGRRNGKAHPVRPAALGADQRNHALDHRNGEREDQREMTKLGDHGRTRECMTCQLVGFAGFLNLQSGKFR